MFIAHLPAGYLLTKGLFRQKIQHSNALFWTGLFFSIAPDLDLFWFYLVSNRQAPHHQYITHWPLFWTALACGVWFLAKLFRKPGWRPYLFIAYANVLLHLILDSIAAEIYWLAPLSRVYVNLAHVPAVYTWWGWNFFLHWTFALELCLCVAAGVVYVRGRRKLSKESS